MSVPEFKASERIAAAREKAVVALLAARNPRGWWTGELSSSALSTATAVCALAVVERHSPRPHCEIVPLLDEGLAWLVKHQNVDGGWGDTDRSISNLSTTTLVWAAFGVVPGAEDRYRGTVDAAENWLRSQIGTLEPALLADAIAARYGNDRTFLIPILALCAIVGRLGPPETAWCHVSQLPFELAVLPARWFGAMRLPVVSYALPALIAIGQVRHHFRPTRNPFARWLRQKALQPTLRTLARIQPPNGGFLEATPLTAFVTMSLAAMGLALHPVVTRGVAFLVKSVRPDGSWAIDTNLSTWLTTLAVDALGGVGGCLPASEAQSIRDWLLGQQYRVVHPYTNAAPGGWAWTDLPGGVPDADDTAGTLLALRRLGAMDDQIRHAAAAGVEWLIQLQNSDGGIPTFCKGWGTLPFDRSSPDITAHALRAWTEWLGDLPPTLGRRTGRAISRALGFLAKQQKTDGSWVPLWFGHQEAVNDENPLYGTARVLVALRIVGRGRDGMDVKDISVAARLAVGAERWLVARQNADGGWAGAVGAVSSVEETAIALEALTACAEQETDGVSQAIEKGLHWLVARVETGEWQNAAPIGFYFARLWYYEALYPVIFGAGALRAAGMECVDTEVTALATLDSDQIK